jgi:hypothetical protein
VRIEDIGYNRYFTNPPFYQPIDLAIQRYLADVGKNLNYIKKKRREGEREES